MLLVNKTMYVFAMHTLFMGKKTLTGSRPIQASCIFIRSILCILILRKQTEETDVIFW